MTKVIDKKDFPNGVNFERFKDELGKTIFEGRILTATENITCITLEGDDELNDTKDLKQIDDLVSAHDGSTFLDRSYDSSNLPSSTTNTTFQEKLKHTVNLSGGDYIVKWCAEASNTDASEHTVMQIQVDDDPTKIVGTPEIIGDDPNWFPVSGFEKITLAAGSHDFDFDFKTTAGTATADIRKVRIIVEKWE